MPWNVLAVRLCKVLTVSIDLLVTARIIVTVGDVSSQLILVFAAIAVITYIVSKKVGHAIFHTTENGILGGLAGVYFLLDTFGTAAIQTAITYMTNVDIF